MTPKLPGLLVRYIQQNRCVVFVGAGLSAGAGLPTWNKLLLKGIEELVGSLPEGEEHQKELQALVEKGKLLEVADFCKEELGAATYHQFLAEQVRGDLAELPRTHDVLMHLPFSAWVTTNYDKLLERAFSKVKGGFPKTLTHRDTEALGRLLFDGGQFILKAHGDIDRPETVVLTSRDYSDIIHANPAFNEVFSGLLLTKALLFVGYSLADPDFRLLMDRQLTHFKGFVPERYALMSGVGQVEREVLARTARIQVISYENASGKHAEVLHFLEALKAAVHPQPAQEVGGSSTKTSIPTQVVAAPQSGPVRSHNMAEQSPAQSSWVSGIFETLSFSSPAPPPAAARAPGAPARAAPPQVQAEQGPAQYLELVDDEQSPGSILAGSAEEQYVPSVEAQPVPPMSPQRDASSPQPFFVSSQARLLIRRVMGVIQFGLRGQNGIVGKDASKQLDEDVWLSLKRAVEGDTKSHAWLYGHLPRLFEKYVPREVLQALGGQDGASQEPLVLGVSPALARFPWELLPLHGQPVCLKRELVRAPVGISDQARGSPQVRSSPRILLIEGRMGTSAGGPREIERLARQYQGAQGFSCKVLQGEEATFARIMSELDEALPDLLHYTGDVGQMDGELYLKLPGDMDLSAGALRSVLSRGRLPFLVMNAPSSAFAPYGFGVYPVEQGYHRLPIPNSRAAIFEGREGFMDLATQMGVGAFVGAFDIPSAKAGTAFMAALHRDLLTGLPIADAVLRARQEVHKEFPDDPTALQYVLSGDGNLQLWDSRREDEQA